MFAQGKGQVMAQPTRIRQMAKLAGNALRYRRLRRSGSPWRLESLSLEITHRCFCRCRMCNIWQIPAEVPDLDLAFWRQVLCSPELHHLRELDLTGGEPFLRHDIGSLLATISELQATQFPKLRTLAITTNGILTDRILEQVGAVVNELGRRGIDLVLACGMDAVGDLHDRIRNHPGAWRSLERTLDGLARLRRSSPRLVLGIKTTVIPENVRYLESIAAYASERDIFTIISPRIITANRFCNSDNIGDLQFSAEDRREMARFFASPRFSWSGHREALVRYLRTGTMRKPCSAGFNTLFVRYSGDVCPCPVAPVVAGNLRGQSLGDVYRSAIANDFRKRVRSLPDCRVCTEPGLERTALTFEGACALRLAWRAGGREFDRMVQQMGLDKFL